jgi:hypothetical protein
MICRFLLTNTVPSSNDVTKESLLQAVPQRATWRGEVGDPWSVLCFLLQRVSCVVICCLHFIFEAVTVVRTKAPVYWDATPYCSFPVF